MPRQSLQSRLIRSVQWDPATRVLEVEFHQGRVYRYAGVPYEAWVGLMKASSKGAYLRREIQPKYQASEVAPGRS